MKYMALRKYQHSISKFLRAGFDIYPQMYNPSPDTLEAYLQEMDSHIENFSLKIHIGPLKLYGPNKARITAEAIKRKVEPADLIKEMTSAWDHNYERSCEIIDTYLRERHGVGYRDTTRSDVRLK